MDRLACISLPSLALQVGLQRFPPGFQGPLALVRDNRPASPILQVNKMARSLGPRAGWRYSDALAVVADLKAVTVSAADLERARGEVLDILSRWSPQVEPCPFDPAAFWVGVSGLTGLYGSEGQWGAAVRAALAARRYRAVVVVGTSRGGTWVLTKTRKRSTVVRSPRIEQQAFDQAPPSIFPLGFRNLRLLERLGLTTLSSVLRLPADELGRRLGPGLVRDFRLLETYRNLPLQGVTQTEEVIRARRLDPPVSDIPSLISLLDDPLDDGLAYLDHRAWLLAELRVVFVLEEGGWVSEVLRPADPTTSRALVRRLLGLRVPRCPFAGPVSEVRLAFHHVPQPPATGELFAPETVRDLHKGTEALALIRAQWGNDTVVRAVSVDSHIPERSYRWEPLDRLEGPRATSSPEPESAAVRRVRRGAGPVPGNPSGERLGMALRLKVVTGAETVDREYWFLRNGRGETVWVSRDLVTGETRWEGVVD